MRLALHARGWRGLFERITRTPEAGPEIAATEVAAPPAAAPAPQAKRILFIDVSAPRPDRDSGSLRAFNLMRAMRAQGHAVDFLPDDRHDAGAATARLRELGIGVHAGAGTPGYPQWLSRHGGDYDAVVVCRYHLGEFLIPLLRRLSPRALVILDTVDLHHLREAREAELHGDRTLARLAERTLQRELRAITAADVTWVVSPFERALLEQRLPIARVQVMPNIHEALRDPPGFGSRQGALFLGGARHPPNADAVRWLLRDILPPLRQRLPGLPVHLVGDGLSDALRGHAIPSAVQVHGFVPDIAPLLASCRVGLAPLRFGAGVKGKITTCMAAGMPVVATACAAEGMHLRDGEDVLLAEGADAFADAVARLHSDAALWHRLMDAGLRNVERHFSFDTARAALAATLAVPH